MRAVYLRRSVDERQVVRVDEGCLNGREDDSTKPETGNNQTHNQTTVFREPLKW